MLSKKLFSHHYCFIFLLKLSLFFHIFYLSQQLKSWTIFTLTIFSIEFLSFLLIAFLLNHRKNYYRRIEELFCGAKGITYRTKEEQLETINQ